MAMIALLGLLLLTLSVLLRALFLFKLETISSDNYAHRWLISERKLQGGLRQETVSRSLIAGYRGYPPLSHWLLARFFPNNFSTAGRLLNIAYDSLTVVVVYAVLLTILGRELYFESFGLALVYSTTPILLPAQPRMLAMGARTLGCLLYSLFLLFYAGYHFSGDPMWLVPCSLMSLLVILSSQFAMQALAWSSFFLSIWLWSFAPAAGFVGGVLLSLLPWFDGRRLFYRKWQHYVWYVEYLRRNRNASSGVAARNRYQTTIAPLRRIFDDPLSALSPFLGSNSWVAASYSLPVAWGFLFLSFRDSNGMLATLYHDPAGYLLLGVLSAAVTAFVLTSLRPLLFLGEAERYFEFGLGTLVLLTGWCAWKSGWGIERMSVVLVAVNLTIVLIGLLSSCRLQLKRAFVAMENQNFKELRVFLESSGDRKIMTLPTKFAFKLACDMEGHRFYFDNVCVSGRGMRYMHDEHIHLHYFNPDPEYFQKKYGIDTVVVSRYALSLGKGRGLDYEACFNDWDVVFENKDYLVYAKK